MLGLSKKQLLAQALSRAGQRLTLRRAAFWSGVLILNYHRIGRAGDPCADDGLWSATPEEFEEQVRTASTEFDLIGMADLDHAMKQTRGRYVMMTFDDGYLDNYEYAYPILTAHGGTATFFITTGFLDNPRLAWWDEVAWMVKTTPVRSLKANSWTGPVIRWNDSAPPQIIRRLLRVYKQLDGRQTGEYLDFLGEALETGRAPAEMGRANWMTWDQVREMRRGGMTIGGHTVNHPILANLTPEAQDFEVGECCRRIEAELGEPCRSFSYPVGGPHSYNETTREMMRRHGIEHAFTYCGGFCRVGQSDRLSLQRTPIESDLGDAQFRALLMLPQVFA